MKVDYGPEGAIIASAVGRHVYLNFRHDPILAEFLSNPRQEDCLLFVSGEPYRIKKSSRIESLRLCLATFSAL